MFRMFSVILAAALLLSVNAYAQSDVTGAWDLAVTGPDGSPVNAVATLKQEGEKVTGEIESQAGKAALAGTMKGKTLSMAFTMQTPQGPMDIKVAGEVDGTSMKGTIDLAGMGQMEFTAKKK